MTPGTMLLRWYPEVKNLEGIEFEDRDGRWYKGTGEVPRLEVTGVVRGTASHSGRLLVILTQGETDQVLVFENEVDLKDFYTYVTGRPIWRPRFYYDDDSSMFPNFFICR